jgi:hypothetical protein
MTCAYAIGKSFIRRPESIDHKLFMMISTIIFYVHNIVTNTKLKKGTHIFRFKNYTKTFEKTREMYTYSQICMYHQQMALL